MTAHYFDEAAPGRVVEEYPLGRAFVERVATLPREQLRALQEARFETVMRRAWQVPFYARRWREAGIAPRDIRSLADLPRLPAFSKSDLMASVAAYPPLGDFHGMDDGPDGRRQVVLHTTSGTTGDPQPLLYGAFDREVQNALLARTYRLQGLRDDDVVHSVYGFGLVNGGHYVREAITHYTRALLLTPGTGVETPSERQVELMARFGVTVLVGFADYLFRLAEVAQAKGLEPGRDLRVRLISGHIPHDRREELAQAWGGATVHDWYGVGDTGTIAAEAHGADGLWLYEDAHFVELLDTESGAPAAPGAPGNQCVTVLFKDTVYPIVRFNTQDVSAFVTDKPANGWTLKRMRGFLGRSDNMVKLRGINVYPTAFGALLTRWPEATGEYVCRVRHAGASQSMHIEIEWSGERAGAEGVAAAIAAAVGVRIEVALVPPGATAEATGVNSRQKPIRLIDER